MTGHYVHHVVWNESTVTLRDCVGFFQYAGNIAEEIRRKRQNDKRLAFASDDNEDI